MNDWRDEVRDAARAAAGGMLFGVPLLYTMEVWWIGSYASPSRMLAVLAATYVGVVVLNRTSGFRSTKDVKITDALVDAVEAVAIGIVCVFIVLVLIGEFTWATPGGELLGKTVYESTPFVVGVGLARHFLRSNRNEGDDDEGEEADEGEESRINATLADFGGTVLGATFVAFNIAPTDEVPMISAALPPVRLLALLAASVAISYVIVFQAGFSNEEKRRSQKGVLQRPVTETVACYLAALVVSAGLLWFFRRAPGDPAQFVLAEVLVLGLPAAVGGAAGRLAV